jgi:hypothetical protein
MRVIRGGAPGVLGVPGVSGASGRSAETLSKSMERSMSLGSEKDGLVGCFGEGDQSLESEVILA